MPIFSVWATTNIGSIFTAVAANIWYRSSLPFIINHGGPTRAPPWYTISNLTDICRCLAGWQLDRYRSIFSAVATFAAQIQPRFSQIWESYGDLSPVRRFYCENFSFCYEIKNYRSRLAFSLCASGRFFRFFSSYYENAPEIDDIWGSQPIYANI